MNAWRSILIIRFFALSIIIFPVSAPSQEQTQQPPPAQEPAPESGQVIIPRSSSAEAEPQPGQPEAQPTPQAQREKTGPYIIKEGDTLWDISNAFLRDPFLWPLLWKANPYITNPDLIYPGNKLAIPSLAPIERAMEMPEEKAAEEKMAEERPADVAETRAPEVSEYRRPRRAVRRAEPEEAAQEEAPSGPRLLLPEEAAVPIIDKYAMLNAGFVDTEETDDRIVGSLESKTIFAYDDIVYINVSSMPEANVGDKFTIYETLKKVKHPVTGDNFGRLIKVLGILQVTARDSPEALTARITISFDAIEMGSLITPYQEPSLVYEPSEKQQKDITGYILEVVDGRTVNAQLDVVYLDKGSLDGINPGDRFNVYIEQEGKSGFDLPRKVIGEIQVFLTKDRTSTGVVRKSVDTIAKGDMIEFKK